MLHTCVSGRWKPDSLKLATPPVIQAISWGGKRGWGCTEKKEQEWGWAQDSGKPFMWKKREWERKWRGNCKALGHTCWGLKETGRDMRISVKPVGEREDRCGEGSLFSELSRQKGVWKSHSRLSGLFYGARMKKSKWESRVSVAIEGRKGKM